MRSLSPSSIPVGQRTRGLLPAFAAVMALLQSAPAGATGGLSCKADDQNLELAVSASLRHGADGQFLGLTGRLVIRAGAPAELARLQLRLADLPQRWLSRSALKLRLFRETARGAFMVLDIETASGPEEEGEYRGSYSLTLFDPRKGAGAEQTVLTGKAACTAE